MIALVIGIVGFIMGVTSLTVSIAVWVNARAIETRVRGLGIQQRTHEYIIGSLMEVTE